MNKLCSTLEKLKQIGHKYLYCIALVGFIASLFMLLHGLSPSPNFGSLFQITQDISVQQLETKDHWLEQSFLFPLIAFLTGLNYSIESYFIFLTINIFITLIAIATLFANMFSNDKSAFLLMILMASGAIITLNYWIGYSDPFILLYGTVAVLVIGHENKSIPLASILIVVSFCAAIAHFYQAFIVLFLALFVSQSLNKNTCFMAGLSLLGLLAGKLILQLYFNRHGFNGMPGLEYLVAYDVVEGIGSFNANRIDFIVSIFRFGWPVIFYFFYLANNTLRIRFLLSFFIVVLSSIVALDHSRVASILSWPLLLSASIAVYNAPLKKALIGPIAASLVCFSLLYPVNHVWGSQSLSSPLTNQAYKFGQNILVQLYTNISFSLYQPTIPLNTEIKFDDDRLDFYGWSSAERNHRWSQGKSNSIYFQITETENIKGNFKLKVRSLGTQEIGIALNGVSLGSIVVNPENDIISVAFSSNILSQDKKRNKLTFVFSNPHVPNSQDNRLLALSMKWLMVE